MTEHVRQPALFLPHGGGPCFFMDWTWGPADTWHPTQRFLESIQATLPAPPKAMLVISGHWEEPGFTAGAVEKPELIFDYSGFPPHTYQLTWPAPGDPELAARVTKMLREAGLPAGLSRTRGYDHGIFVPLKVAFPQAQIPVVPLSLDRGLDPELHLAAGRVLATLRDEGVLIIASGMSFHNLRAYMRPETTEPAAQFDAWLTKAIESSAPQRNEMLRYWQNAPNASFAHPRAEHLIPLMVAAGAGGEAPGKRIFHDQPMGAAITAYRFDG
ncbi:DODA-type extradiol aromatic ring-opening family dioxygenase [Occallatibacter riparius]|uniref:Dioxygenase n=1 Tax=Occallatibacter riparius TaxID=1002689 RepID=A0A9J7BWV5_9BACT|nr:class III extradiol ring-cleavage dioxygenase [Occallatibacter riparius]UWZ85358.1 dioxygenase [Occallatibacter riparius]